MAFLPDFSAATFDRGDFNSLNHVAGVHAQLLDKVEEPEDPDAF